MRLPRPPSAVIFDMDGVLFDTEILYQESLFAAAAAAGVEMTDAVAQRMIGCSWVVNRTQLLAHYGADFAVDDLRAGWMAQFDHRIADRLALKPGVVDLLDLLDALGLPRAIATSSAHATVRDHLDRFALMPRFDAVVAMGDYANGKPAPDPFLLAAQRLGHAPAGCLVVEDSHNGVRAGAAAGMMTVMVPDRLPATPEIAALCVGVLPDLAALGAALDAVRA